MVGGGSFGTGFASGAVGNLTGGLGETDLVARTAYAGAAAGVAAWATGGDFMQGVQSGAYAQMYNWGRHEGKEWLNNMGGGALEQYLKRAMRCDTGTSSLGEGVAAIVKSGAKYVENKAIDAANLGIDAINIVGPINIVYGLMLETPLAPLADHVYNHINYDSVHGSIPPVPHIKSR